MIGLWAGRLKGFPDLGRSAELISRAMHRICLPDPEIRLEVGALVQIAGDEAHHAVRVKRLADGDRIELFDGAGRSAVARINRIEKVGKKGGWLLLAECTDVRCHEPPRPTVEVWSAAPKGPRLESMIEQLSQIGVARWGPLVTTRSVVDPRQGKLDRLARTARESAKQCGRPWILSIEPGLTLKQAVNRRSELVVADASGEPYAGSGAAAITLLVGPEGGWTPEELAMLRQAGARVASFGRHTMRIESAAVAAGTIVIDQEQRFAADAGTRPKETNT